VLNNNLKVSLDTRTSPLRLDVDQHGNANHVSRSSSMQTIAWQLTGNAATGSFNAQDAPQPGFAWIEAPPAGIFGPPAPGENGKTITMNDLNNSAGTTGEWIYRLSATIDGQVYQSEAISIGATTTNPSIKNN
jgi:hypothetical protein